MNHLKNKDYIIKKQINEVIVYINTNNYHGLLLHLFSELYNYLKKIKKSRRLKIFIFLRNIDKNKIKNTTYKNIDTILLLDISDVINVNTEFDNIYNDFIKIKDILNMNCVKKDLDKLMNFINTNEKIKIKRSN